MRLIPHFDGTAETVYVDKETGNTTAVPESVQKEFQVVQLIDGYRTRGHLFTKTNPVRERRKYTPTLGLENFGLSQGDLNTVLNENGFRLELILIPTGPNFLMIKRSIF